MDRITKKLLEDFLTSQELTQKDESDDFELFCNYIAISNEYNKSFDPLTLTAGKGNDTGIDGIAIIVNGRLIEDTNDIDDLLASNGYLEATYILFRQKLRLISTQLKCAVSTMELMIFSQKHQNYRGMKM